MTQRQLIAMCENNLSDGNDGVPIWETQPKKVASNAEKSGLVKIEKTNVRFAGLVEWRVRLAS